MSTVEKALSLLDLFAGNTPELGLSDVARASGFDKATTRRLLLALSNRELVEQDPATRRYRLGPGLLRLARIREAQHPFHQLAAPLMRALSQETGETAHLSEFKGGRLMTIHVAESMRANRVGVDVGQILPLHATASGIAFLSRTRPGMVRACLAEKLEARTPHTLIETARVMELVRRAADQGYSTNDQGYEEGVFSVGAPVLGPDGDAIGALAVAAPVGRIDDDVVKAHGRQAIATAAAISRRLFGMPPGQALGAGLEEDA